MVKNIKNPVSLQNIHFGKIILTFMLVGMMILGNVEPVKASEPLYYYEKYYVNTKYELVYGTEEEKKLLSYRRYLGAGGQYYGSYGVTTYSTYSIQSDGTVKLGGDTGVIGFAGGGKYFYSSSVPYEIVGHVRTSTEPGGNSGEYSVYYHERVRSMSTKTVKEKGSYHSKVTGTYNQYPANGVHTDGYWYVRKGLVNNNPTLSISTPTENSYFV